MSLKIPDPFSKEQKRMHRIFCRYGRYGGLCVIELYIKKSNAKSDTNIFFYVGVVNFLKKV